MVPAFKEHNSKAVRVLHPLPKRTSTRAGAATRLACTAFAIIHSTARRPSYNATAMATRAVYSATVPIAVGPPASYERGQKARPFNAPALATLGLSYRGLASAVTGSVSVACTAFIALPTASTLTTPVTVGVIRGRCH